MQEKKQVNNECPSPDIASKNTAATDSKIQFNKSGLRDATDEEEK